MENDVRDTAELPSENEALKRRIAELAEAEDRFRAFFDDAPIGKSMTAPDGRLLRVNRAFGDMLGYSLAEMQRVSFAAITHPDDVAESRECIRALLAGERDDWTMEKRYIAKDGREVWTHVVTRLHRDPQGKPLNFLTHIQDITDRRRADERIHHLNQVLKAIRNVNQLIVREKDRATLIQEACESLVETRYYRAVWIRLPGADPSPPLLAQTGWGEAFEPFREKLHAGWLPPCWDKARATVNGLAVLEPRQSCRDCPLAQAYGHDAAGVVSLRHDGNDFGTLGICLAAGQGINDDEVSLLTEVAGDLALALHGIGAAAALRQSEERNRATLHSIGDAVIATDTAGRLTQMNPVAETLTGWSGAEAEGHAVHEIFRIVNEETRATVESPVDRVLREGTIVGLANHTVLIAKDGTERPIADSGAPIRDAQGTVTGVVLVFRDQTAERAAEKALVASEEKYRSLFDNAEVGMYRSRLDGSGITALNQRLADIFGFTKEEMLASPATLRWADPKAREQMVELLRARGELTNHELDIVTKGGAVRTVLASIKLYPSEGYLEGTAIDITERKLAEARLAERQTLLQNLVESAGQVIFSVDRDYRYTSFNTQHAGVMKALYGADIELGRSLIDYQRATPDYVQAKQNLDRALAGEQLTDEGFSGEDTHTRAYFEVTHSPVRDPAGSVIGVAVFARDTTARRRAEEEIRVLNVDLEQRVRDRTSELQSSKELLDQTGRLARVGGWAIDLEKNELTWTDVVRQIHEVEPGYRPTVAAGINFYAPEAVPVISEAVRRAIEEGQPFDVELQLITAKKNRIWVRALGEATRKDGKVTLVRGVFQDIHVRKVAELELQKYREHLEESNQELEAFSYSVSHDLRAPLRAIDGFARILADDYAPKLDQEAKRVCSVIRENTGKMSRLIDDLLTFSRLGRAEMQPSEIDMTGMARAIFHEVTTPAERARIQFQLQAMPTAVGDPSLMRQVWINLLGNAVKFSSKREQIIITAAGEVKDGERVYSVRDNGAGFDMRYVAKLFGVFQRLHSAKDFEGTGVGLALVHRVVRRHGGRVWAEGEPDRGATFHFALPQRGR